MSREDTIAYARIEEGNCGSEMYCWNERPFRDFKGTQKLYDLKVFFLSLKLLLARKEIVIWKSIIDTEYFYFQCVINNFKIKLLNVIFEQFNVSI